MTELADENEAEMREKAPDDEGEEESDDDDEVITEIRFVPSDKAACECVCVLLVMFSFKLKIFHAQRQIFLYSVNQAA